MISKFIETIKFYFSRWYNLIKKMFEKNQDKEIKKEIYKNQNSHGMVLKIKDLLEPLNFKVASNIRKEIEKDFLSIKSFNILLFVDKNRKQELIFYKELTLIRDLETELNYAFETLINSNYDTSEPFNLSLLFINTSNFNHILVIHSQKTSKIKSINYDSSIFDYVKYDTKFFIRHFLYELGKLCDFNYRRLSKFNNVSIEIEFEYDVLLNNTQKRNFVECNNNTNIGGLKQTFSILKVLPLQFFEKNDYSIDLLLNSEDTNDFIDKTASFIRAPFEKYESDFVWLKKITIEIHVKEY